MKVESIVINVLVAVVAVLAGHIFWPGVPVPGKTPDLKSMSDIPVGTPAVPANPNLPASLFNSDLHAKLEKARQAALAANPALKSEEDNLNNQRQAILRQSPPATPQARAALMTQWRDHAQKMRAAIIAIDPTLQDFFTQMDSRFQTQQQLARTQTTPPPSTPSATKATGPNGTNTHQ